MLVAIIALALCWVVTLVFAGYFVWNYNWAIFIIEGYRLIMTQHGLREPTADEIYVAVKKQYDDK